MEIGPGSKFGSYEILTAIGAGGMGQVYRARDASLRRDVAVKVLSEGVAKDADRLARFEREAHVLASLNHPNIAAIYGLERIDNTPLLIMELVPGQTLAERLKKGALAIDDALAIAVQIATALEAAHDKGIVHRDLKPANVIVTPEGQVKVLDFGLAKHLAAATGFDAGNDLSHSPTMAGDLASAGLIVGTAAYMSPEQARGKAVDRRTDIWSFGCVLYEMLAGAPAFAGDTLTDVLAAVINQEPEWFRLPGETPPAIRALLRRCLQRNPGRRVQHAGDARIEIEEALTEPSVHAHESPAPQSRRSVVRTIVPWALAALLAIALGVTQLDPQRAAAPGPAVTRLELNMPPGVEAGVTSTPTISISPDGERLVFVGGTGGLRRLYVRRFDESESTPLRGTETANICVFSPDGREVAFISSDRTLKRVSLADGLVSTVTGNAEYNGGGLTWGPDGTLTFVRTGALWRVRSNGGDAQQLTRLDGSQNERAHLWPVVVGGHGILFGSVSGSDRTITRIEALSLTTGKRHVVVDEARNPIHTTSGHLLFFRSGTLLAATFNAESLEVTGSPTAVLENISLDQLGGPLVTVSRGGLLAYIATGNATKRLVSVSREGIEQPITDASRPYQNPRLSPDGGRIVVEVAGGDLWIQDLARSTFTRLTSGATIGNTFAVWTPDGRRIVYRTLTGLYEIDTDGGGQSRGIPNTSVADIPTSISPDGLTLAYIHQSPEGGGDVYTLPLRKEGQPGPLVSTSGYDGGGQFSPDGRWMAYVSNESGRYEVSVRPYPGPDRKIQVSTQGGTHPRWNRNGKEIFYRSGNRMMVVDVSTNPDLKLSAPRLLFEQRYAFGGAQTVPNYDVSADGKRFLMIKDESSSGRLNIVLNWFNELNRLAPPAGR